MSGTTYLIWKDPSIPAAPDNWIRLSAKEYYDFRRSPESDGRYFIRMGDGLRENGEVIEIEATREQYRKWRREHDRCKYLKRQARGVKVVSADILSSSEETLISVLPGEAAIPEEEILKKEMHDSLSGAIRELGPEDKELLLTYVPGSVPTIQDLCERRGMASGALWKRRARIRKKILKRLE